MTPEQRHEYYLANKDKWNKHAFINLPEEKKKQRLEYQKKYRELNRDKVNNSKRLKRENRWKEAIALLGGCCSKCGGIFDPVCYDFHHVNPEEKKFTIGENMQISKQKLFDEIKKCILVCSNCHRLIHKKEIK